MSGGGFSADDRLRVYSKDQRKPYREVMVHLANTQDSPEESALRQMTPTQASVPFYTVAWRIIYETIRLRPHSAPKSSFF